MEVILGVVIGIAGLLGIVFSRILTTFVHELGHALTALILTEGPVEMYVGSYGDTARSVKIKLGRLTLYLSFIIWDLEIGLCRHDRASTISRDLLVIISGPLLSLVFAFVMLYLLIFLDFSDGFKFLLAVLVVSSIWDFFVNVIPRRNPITLHDRSRVYNDGKQFVTLYRKGKLPVEYQEVMDLKASDDWMSALTLTEKLIESYPKERIYMEERLEIIHKVGTPHDYVAAFEEYLLLYKPDLKYVAMWAAEKIKLHDYDEVVQKLTKIIYEGKGNYDMYFLRGKALTELGEYKDAMRDFHALTLGKEEDPLALANRAYCQYRLGYEEEAREDVMEAIQNGKSNMGEIYYLAGVLFESYDDVKALGFYKNAERLKYNHHALAFNISRIEKYK